MSPGNDENCEPTAEFATAHNYLKNSSSNEIGPYRFVNGSYIPEYIPLCLLDGLLSHDDDTVPSHEFIQTKCKYYQKYRRDNLWYYVCQYSKDCNCGSKSPPCIPVSHELIQPKCKSIVCQYLKDCICGNNNLPCIPTSDMTFSLTLDMSSGEIDRSDVIHFFNGLQRAAGYQPYDSLFTVLVHRPKPKYIVIGHTIFMV